jgi:uncharacterized protein YciI
MSYFVVTRERGAGWDWSRALTKQRLWDEHAEFMDALVEDGLILLGGPVGERGSPLLIVEADDEESVRARLAEDPWEPFQMLTEPRVERWELRLGSLS